MQFKSIMFILGAKSSKGDYQGVAYDKTVIYYKTELQDGVNFVGEIGEEIRWGTSANFEKIKDLEFPLVAEVTLEQVSNGKTSMLVLLDVKPQKPQSSPVKQSA